MKLTKLGLEKLKNVFVGSDTMWKIIRNDYHRNYNACSDNFQRELFKKLNLYNFRLLNKDYEPMLWGIASDNSKKPLYDLKKDYPVQYIQFSKNGTYLSPDKPNDLKKFAYWNEEKGEYSIILASKEQIRNLLKKVPYGIMQIMEL